MKIKDEMSNWKDYKKHGKKRAFDWSITESILNSKNTISEILTAFGENSIDFVVKVEDIEVAYSYIYDILEFYCGKIKGDDKKEIVNQALFFLSEMSSLMMDNPLVADVWGNLIYGLIQFQLFSFKNFDELKDLSGDQLKAVFEVANKAIEYFEEDKRATQVKSLQDISIFKNNISLLSTIIDLDA